MNKKNVINSAIQRRRKIISSISNEYIYCKNKKKAFYNINVKAFKNYEKSIFIIILISSLLKESFTNKRNINLFSSYIILKTNVTGYVKIFSDDFFDYGILPNETRINDIIQSEIKNEYYLNDSSSVINVTFYDYPKLVVGMFKGCSNLTEIDLSNFHSSKIQNMAEMFRGCSSLYSIDFSNIDTSNVKNMNSMFYGCSSLSSLNLSYFYTSQLINSQYMFYGCSSLTSLDISFFDTSQIQNIQYMFYGCSSLNSLNLSNFKLTKDSNAEHLFSGCSKLEYIILENSYFDKDDMEEIFESNNDNLIICGKYLEFEYIFLENILINCTNQIYEDANRIKCYSNNISTIIKYSCEICGESFHQMYNDINNNKTFFNCYESLKDYCKYNYYYNLTSKMFYCTEDNNCPEEYDKLITEKKQCIEDCKKDSIYKYELNNICFSKLKENENIENKPKLISNIINELLNEFNESDMNNGRDNKRVVGNDLIIILTSTQNQKINENISNITMNLGQCENLLKNDYNISKNDSLYILEIISQEEGMKIPKIEYEIYYPLHNNNSLTKLNLNICKDTKIEISIAVKINDKLDKYNISSNYYNDNVLKQHQKVEQIYH